MKKGEETMKTENELIAEFMGYRWIGEHWFDDHMTKNAAQKTGCFVEVVKYDTSWDWLMPVVEKIEELYKKDFDPTEWVDSVLKGEPKKGEIKYMDVIALPLASKIDEAYKNVVDFIRWYNSQNS